MADEENRSEINLLRKNLELAFDQVKRSEANLLEKQMDWDRDRKEKENELVKMRTEF